VRCVAKKKDKSKMDPGFRRDDDAENGSRPSPKGQKKWAAKAAHF